MPFCALMRPKSNGRMSLSFGYLDGPGFQRAMGDVLDSLRAALAR